MNTGRSHDYRSTGKCHEMNRRNRRQGRMPLACLLAVFSLMLVAPVGYATDEAVLAGHWRLDEAGGNTASDSSPFSNAGTLVNMATGTCWVGGVEGTALAFDGVDDYVRVPHSVDLELWGDFSISLWYKPSIADSTTAQCFLQKSVGDYKASWAFLLNPSGQLALHTNATGLEDDWLGVSTIAFSTQIEEWTHIAVVKSGTEADFYQNGELLADSGAELHEDLFPNDEPIQIGRDGAKAISGVMDDVKVYQGVLNEEQIRSISVIPILEGVTLRDSDEHRNIDPVLYANQTLISVLLEGLEGYIESVHVAEDDQLVVNLSSYWRPPLGDYDGSTLLEYELEPGDGLREVWVVVRNDAGTSFPPQSASITLDTVGPTVEVTGISESPTGDSPIQLLVAFSEPVHEFGPEDVVLGGVGGVLSGFSGSGTEFVLGVIPNEDGDLLIAIPADCAFDLAGNGNLPSQTHTHSFNSSLPGLFTDDFSIPHDYSQGDVSGTIWDGVIGAEDIVTMDADATNSGELTIVAGNNRWALNDKGVFLYKNVPGNFVAEVEVTWFDNPEYHAKGLMARIPTLVLTGEEEDYVLLKHFDQFEAGNLIRTMDNGEYVDQCIKGGSAHKYLQLERNGSKLYFRTRAEITDPWMDLPGTPIERGDLFEEELQVGIWQHTCTENIGTVRFDNFLIETHLSYAAPSAVVIDGFGTAQDSYTTLSNAYEALERYDGVPDTINITTNTLIAEEMFLFSGSDDLIINGDADQNDAPCNIVINGDHPFCEFKMMSGSNMTLKNVSIVPDRLEGDKTCEAIRYRFPGNLVNSKLSLQNVVVTSSGDDNAPYEIEEPYDLSKNSWLSAFHSIGIADATECFGNTVEFVHSALGQTTRETIHLATMMPRMEVKFIDTTLSEGRTCGLMAPGAATMASVKFDGCLVSGYSIAGIAFGGDGDEATLELVDTIVSNNNQGVMFSCESIGATLEIGKGCVFTDTYGDAAVTFHSIGAEADTILAIAGTSENPVQFLGNTPRSPKAALLIGSQNGGRYAAELSHVLFVDNEGKGLRIIGTSESESSLTLKKCLFAHNDSINVHFTCGNLDADVQESTFHHAWWSQQNNAREGNTGNTILYRDCIFTGRSRTDGANHIAADQENLSLTYDHCALVTEGPDGMGIKYLDFHEVATIVELGTRATDPIFLTTDRSRIRKGAFDVRHPSFAGQASGGGDLTGWGSASFLDPAENHSPEFVAQLLEIRDAVLGRKYLGCLIGDVYDADAYDAGHVAFEKISGPAWLEISKDGVLSGSPGYEYLGENQVTISIADRLGATNECTLLLEVIQSGGTVAYESVVSPVWIEEILPSARAEIAAELGDGLMIPAYKEGDSFYYLDNASRQYGTDVHGATAPVALGVPLEANTATEVIICASENGTTLEDYTQSISWKATDLTGRSPASDGITIRQGDSLLLTASGDGSSLSIDADGDGTFESGGVIGDKFPIFYGKPGAYTAAARIDGQDVGSMEIAVVGADLHGPIACEVNCRREKQVSATQTGEDSQVVFTSSDPRTLWVDQKVDSATEPVFYLRPVEVGTPQLQARLGHKYGPVIRSEQIDVFQVYFTPETCAKVIEGYLDGTKLVEVELGVDPVVPDLDIQGHCFGAGATFEDSSIDLYFNTNDFDEDGLYRYRLIKTHSDVCHWLKIYQDGVCISKEY